MLPGRIQGHTRYLGKPPGWEPETDGDCAHLAVLDTDLGGLPIMMSVWEPTPKEIEALARGAKIVLTVVGTGHPPVALHVDEPNAG